MLFDTSPSLALVTLRLPRNGSLALGGGQASPLDMAQAYAMLANGGRAVKPYIIDSIFDSNGEPVFRATPAVACNECVADESVMPAIDDDIDEEADPEYLLEQMAAVVETYRPDATEAPELFKDFIVAPQAITPQNAYLIQDMMRDVVRRGTGARAWRELRRSDLSGKTGTSNDRRDAWFGGFNADIAAVVWVGYDDDLPLGPREEGSRTALPIWIEFIRIALAAHPNTRCRCLKVLFPSGSIRRPAAQRAPDRRARYGKSFAKAMFLIASALKRLPTRSMMPLASTRLR